MPMRILLRVLGPIALAVLIAPTSGAALFAPLAETPAAPVLLRESQPPMLGIAPLPELRAEGPVVGEPEKLSKALIPEVLTAASAAPGLPSVSLGDCGEIGDAGSEFAPTPMSGPGSCDGTIGGDDWSDVYSIYVEGPALLSAGVSITGASPVVLCVYHEFPDNYSETARCDEAIEGSPAHTATYVEAPGTWHIRLRNWYDEVAYHLEFDVRGWATPADCGNGDAPSTSTGALPLSVPSTCEASLDPGNDDADWYALHLDAGQSATVTVVPNEDLDADLCVFEAANLTRPVDCSILSVGDIDRVLLSPALGGDYVVEVVRWDGAGPYFISVNETIPQDDCGSGMDMGSRYRSQPIALPAACAGFLDAAAGDSWDLYRFTLAERGLRVHLTTSDPDAQVCLYDRFGTWPVRCAQSGADKGFAYLAHEAGLTWRIGVITDVAASYELSITQFVPLPQDDCGSGMDAPLWIRGVLLPPDAACAGVLFVDEGDWADVFVVPNLSASMVDVTLRSPVETFEACLYARDTPNSYRGSCREAQNGELHLGSMLSAPGEAVIIVEAVNLTGTMPYDLTVRISPPYSDCGTGGDAAASWESTPPTLSPPVIRCEGKLFVDRGDGHDDYLIRATEGQVILVAIEQVQGRTWACLDMPSGIGICSGPSGTLLDTPGVIALPVTETGDYTLSLTPWVDVPSTYMLSVVVQ